MRTRSGIVRRAPATRLALTASLLLLVGLWLWGGLAAGSAAPATPPAPAPPVASPTATCVFGNPAFAGKCQENAAIPAGSNEQKACESILQCLNDSRCAKTYCQATEIRTGWRLESAKISSAPH
jgi:hypothetical protein